MLEAAPQAGRAGAGVTVSDREARLKIALAHAVGKNHAWSLACWGCLDALAWISVPGYDGQLQAPLLRIGEEAC